MSTEFSGFSEPSARPSGLYEHFLLADECRLFCYSIVRRLGPRIAASRWHAGRDERGGRDYFFENAEISVRGRPDNSHLGFFHYRRPERFAGSHWQVWEWEHDDDPVITLPLDELTLRVGVAVERGQLPNFLDEVAAEIRRELGLQ